MKTRYTVLKMMFFIWSVTSQWINKEKTWRGNKKWEECLFISISLSVHLACWASAVHSEGRNYGILGDFFFLAWVPLPSLSDRVRSSFSLSFLYFFLHWTESGTKDLRLFKIYDACLITLLWFEKQLFPMVLLECQIKGKIQSDIKEQMTVLLIYLFNSKKGWNECDYQ